MSHSRMRHIRKWESSAEDGTLELGLSAKIPQSNVIAGHRVAHLQLPILRRQRQEDCLSLSSRPTETETSPKQKQTHTTITTKPNDRQRPGGQAHNELRKAPIRQGDSDQAADEPWQAG